MVVNNAVYYLVCSNLGVEIFSKEREHQREKGCLEIEHWGFSVQFVLGYQENSSYTLHLRFS